MELVKESVDLQGKSNIGALPCRQLDTLERGSYVQRAVPTVVRVPVLYEGQSQSSRNCGTVL